MLDQQLKAVGPRLRQLRLHSSQTLAEVSGATGISVSTLSRLESGQRQPTLELLLPLAQLYGVPLDDLVRSIDDDPRVNQKPFVRHGSTFVPLTRIPGRLQAYKQTLPLPGDSEMPQQRVHEGYDWLYVLSGRLRLLLGPHDLELGPGEVAEFDTRVPHVFRSAGEHETEILIITGAQGERVHVRASTTK